MKSKVQGWLQDFRSRARAQAGTIYELLVLPPSLGRCAGRSQLKLVVLYWDALEQDNLPYILDNYLLRFFCAGLTPADPNLNLPTHSDLPPRDFVPSPCPADANVNANANANALGSSLLPSRFALSLRASLDNPDFVPASRAWAPPNTATTTSAGSGSGKEPSRPLSSSSNTSMLATLRARAAELQQVTVSTTAAVSNHPAAGSIVELAFD
jgi:hypothetical protein